MPIIKNCAVNNQASILSRKLWIRKETSHVKGKFSKFFAQYGSLGFVVYQPFIKAAVLKLGVATKHQTFAGKCERASTHG
jgi:hypothetical protein